MKEKYKRPTIVLQYLTDRFSKQVGVAKSQCSKGKLFNIVFKGNKNLASLAGECIKKSDSKCSGKVNIEDKLGVIYKAKCKKCTSCETSYVGETGRSLSERMKEHFRPIKDNVDLCNCSAIGEHSYVIHGSQPNRVDWDVNVLDVEMSTQYRKLREAYWIARCNARLNRGMGVKCILKEISFGKSMFGAVGARLVPSGNKEFGVVLSKNKTRYVCDDQ